MFLTFSGVDVSAGRGETSGPMRVHSSHSELIPAAGACVRELCSLLGRLRGTSEEEKSLNPLLHLNLALYYLHVREMLAQSNANQSREITLVADLCNHLPGGGAVLAGLDAEVPPPLQDVDDGLG